MPVLIPLSDASRRPTRFPICTLILVLLNLAVFAMELSGGEAFVRRWAVIPADISAGRHWVTLLTAIFLHGGWGHLIGNMLFLLAFGPEVEDAMGRGRYLVFYLLGGLFAFLAQVVAIPHSTMPNLGASGAIAAVMGAFLVTYPGDQVRVLLAIFFFVRVRQVPAVLLIGVWFLIQIANIGSVADVQGGGVAYVAHVAGLIFGALAARPFQQPNLLRDVTESQ